MRFSKKILIIIGLTLSFLIPSYALSAIQWASKVVNSSGGFIANSKKKNQNCFSPEQILYEPKVLDGNRESPCSWTPRNLKNQDFIKVGFDKPMSVEQIAIYENLNPGAISKITLFGEGEEFLAYENNTPKIDKNRDNILRVNIDKPNFNVNEVLIDVNTWSYANDLYQIDAVAISDSKEPIKSEINLSEDVMLIQNPENLGQNINSAYSELAPVISPDGKTLFYTRENYPDNTGLQSIWFSKIDEKGNFVSSKNIGSPLNTKHHNFVISILPDGNSMLVGNEYHKDGTQSSGFSMTYRDGATWSFPIKLKVDNYYNPSRGSYSLASNGKILLLSFDSQYGHGAYDLFVSFLQDDGIWSTPKNLGINVNTADREDSPFLAADGTTLYFSSAGWPGYGSNDIFMTRRLDDSWTKWSKPINLGPKINTDKWDAYFTITASGDYAYFVSSNEPSLGNEDIFRVALPEKLRPTKVILVSGKVLNKKTNEPLDATIMYEKLSTGESCGLARSNPTTGEYKIALPAQEKYSFRAEADGFIPVNEHLDLTIVTNYYEQNQDLVLVPIEEGQTLRINNIFFNTGEYELLPESYPELDRLSKILNENQTIKIALNGHTDNVGTQENNMELSQKRANSVKDFLVIKGGVAMDRIKTKGFGALKPIMVNSTEEGRSKNRRVECEILKK